MPQDAFLDRTPDRAPTLTQARQALRQGAASTPSPVSTLVPILLLALALRLGTGLYFRATVHNDEVFQVLEQAHRLVSGDGIIPWEFRSGIRGWLWPGFVAGLILPLERLSGSPEGNADLVAGFCSLLSLSTVWAAFELGKMISTRHAIVAGFVMAVWFEGVYFSPHPLTEVVATDLMLPGLALLSGPRTRRRLFIAGVLLGGSFVMRPHLAPGLGVACLWAARSHVRTRWVPLALGAALPLLAYGLVDTLTWGTPFSSMVRYVTVNLVDGRSTRYGSEPALWYARGIVLHWGGALALLAVAIAVGARRYPLWFVTAVTIIASHSLIVHKESRFIFPAIACFVILAAIGSVDVLQRLQTRPQASGPGKTLLAGLLAGWVVTSAALATSKSFAASWFVFDPASRAMAYAGRLPSLCGLGLHGVMWHDTPGTSGLHRQSPLYQDGYRTADAPTKLDRAYNVVLATRPAPSLPGDFKLSACFDAPFQDDVCVYARPGDCQAAPDRDLNHWLLENDQ